MDILRTQDKLKEMKQGKLYPRKIQIGTDMKDSAMTYIVGKYYGIGFGKEAKVEQIIVEDDKYEVWIAKENGLFLWKAGNMNFTIENFIDF